MSQKRKIPGFVLESKKELAQRSATLFKNRRPRYKSPIFELPEFEGSPLVSVCLLSGGDTSRADCPNEWEFLKAGGEAKNRNKCMLLNELALEASGKIIIMIPNSDRVQKSTLAQMCERITTSEKSLVCLDVDADCLGLTVDLFYELRGIDELFESATDGLIDLVLRAELIGSTIECKGAFRNNLEAKRNILNGRVVVNQGSPVFK